MDNTKTWWEVHRPSKRKLIQLYSALLYNAHLRGFIEGEIYQGKAKAVCVPGFNCYSCPGAAGACPLGSLQNALACSGHRAGWYVLGIIMIFGLSLGRTICGWLCPLGLIQELLHKIPTPKIPKSRVTRALSYLKYVILAVFAVAIPMWYGIRHDMAIPGFCKYICPAGTFEGAIGLLSNPKNTNYFAMLGILFTRKFVILLVIATTCIFCYRSFCRFICPLGAIYGMFNRLALISVKVDESRCIGCGACVRSCKMDVRHTGDHECINCAKCMSVCNKNALSLKCGNYTILAPDGGCAGDKPDSAEKRAKYSRIAWGIALAVLCFALLWFNFLDPSFKKSAGANAGQQAAQTSGQNAGQQAAAGTESAQADGQEAGTETAQADGQGANTGTETAQASGQDTAAGQGANDGQDATAGTEAPQADGQNANAGTETAQTDGQGANAGQGTGSGQQAAGADLYASTAPIGTAIGNQLADFTVELIDGSTFHLADYRGKVVFLNMWATYCGPCVQEMPVFQSFGEEHADDVVILIIHASDPTEDVAAYVQKKEIKLPCAIDSLDDYIYTLAGADPFVLPHTVVLNRKGEVVYNQARSITAPLLEELYEKAK